MKYLVRTGMLSSATLNDLSSYSNNTGNKHLKFVSTTSMNDLHGMTTPIRLNKSKFTTPSSTQRRRALGLVNHNSNQIAHPLTTDDLINSNPIKIIPYDTSDDPVVLSAPITSDTSHPEDDLPHPSNSNSNSIETFDDLIDENERVERLMRNFEGGMNLFAYYGGLDNHIRCQSPVTSRMNVSTLLDMVDIFN